MRQSSHTTRAPRGTDCPCPTNPSWSALSICQIHPRANACPRQTCRISPTGSQDECGLHIALSSSFSVLLRFPPSMQACSQPCVRACLGVLNAHACKHSHQPWHHLGQWLYRHCCWGHLQLRQLPVTRWRLHLERGAVDEYAALPSPADGPCLQIKNAPHDFRILNHGSVLVAVPLGESTAVS